MKFVAHFMNHKYQGIIPLEEVKVRLKAGREAAELALQKEGVDHVVYASKEFDCGMFIGFHEYLIPMTDKQFQERSASWTRQVYCVHKRPEVNN